jgi:hypothetical protein
MAPVQHQRGSAAGKRKASAEESSEKRIKVMSKKDKAKAKPQIPELAFNNAARAFRHPEGFGNDAIYLNAKEVSIISYKKTMAAAPPESHAKSRLALPFTDKELEQDPPSGLCKYLLVGWVPQNNTQPNATEPEIKHAIPVGNTWPSKEEEIITFDIYDTDNLPLMAVVKVTEDDTRAFTATYVLLRQHDDVCSPYTIVADEVYYLSMFRDQSTTKYSRQTNWNRLARKYAVAQNKKTSAAEQLAMTPQENTALGTAGVSSEDKARFLSSIKNELGEVVKTVGEFTQTPKTKASVLGMDYQDILDTHCEHSETDSTRAAFMDVVKFNSMAMRDGEAHLAQTTEAVTDDL